MDSRQVEVNEDELKEFWLDKISFISYEGFKKLFEAGLIQTRSIRNFVMRKKFNQMRDEGIKSEMAIDKINRMYPHLQFDTVRKIIYGAWQ